MPWRAPEWPFALWVFQVPDTGPGRPGEQVAAMMEAPGPGRTATRLLGARAEYRPLGMSVSRAFCHVEPPEGPVPAPVQVTRQWGPPGARGRTQESHCEPSGLAVTPPLWSQPLLMKYAGDR